MKQKYMKQRRRIQSQLSRMKKKGYDVSGIKVPSIPQKITEGSVRRLEKMTSKKMYEQATYTFPSGETVSGKKAKVRLSREKRQTKKETKPFDYSTPVEKQNEQTIEEFDLLVNMIRAQIDRVPMMPIPNFSKAVGAICSEAFEGFVNSIDEEAKEFAIGSLRAILSESILNQEVYESDQIAEARAWGTSLDQLADYINSQTVKLVASELLTSSDNDGFDFFEVDDDFDLPW